MNSGFKASSTSGGMMVSVIREAAIGAITFEWMLALAPSIAKVSVNATKASFARRRVKECVKLC